ncbi:MAG: M20/M25/M40 family metallo-hydrolase [Anaerolineaceae bacterium]|nr:M20/M25/M40 family metallo-hydrolase [Anaerolineaceae bacterium]
MMEISQFLIKMLSLPGLSGYEAPIRDLLMETWRPLTDDLNISRLGSLHALHRGAGLDSRPCLLISAHMDAIGLMVTGIVNEFLRITEIGGVDDRILPGQRVVVHGRRDLPGVVVKPPDFLLPPGKGGQTVAREYLLVDVGLLPAEVNQVVRLGDLVSFGQEPFELSGEALAGHSLDNRASVAALTVCLQELQHLKHQWDVWLVATTQEEETLGGAFTSPFEIQPDIVIAVDVTFAKGPGVNEHTAYPLGKGNTLGWGPNIHPALFHTFKDLAERLEIPYSMEAMPRHSGTDAYAMQVVAGGAPSMVVGIPLRYMHTPVEMVSLKDIQRAGRILAEFIARLEPDFLNKITWEDH